MPAASTRPATPARGPDDPAPAVPKSGHWRWIICGLLFFAATINYIDRGVIGILKPTLQQEFGWSEMDYADIVFAFQLAYALGFVLAGRMMDRLGTKLGFAIAVFVWTLAAIAHAEVAVFGPAVAAFLAMFGLTYSASVSGFMLARIALGLGEAGNFPASIKAVAEWFPRRERALATGIFNSGTNVGALITPLAVPWFTVTWGWYWAFVATGLLGFLWLALWWPLYDKPERHPRVKAAELAYIQQDPPEPTAAVSWARLLPHRQMWAFLIGKFMTDPIWWLYLFWVPDFLSRTFGLKITGLALPIVIIYQVASIGSIGGGWLSSALIKRRFSVNASRKLAMLICALAVVPIVVAADVDNVWVAVGLVALATAAHQGWSANLFTLASDLFPKKAIGSVVGLGGMAGAMGGMLIAKVTGYVLEASGSYTAVFLIAGSAYLLALAIIHLLVPRLTPVDAADLT